MCVYGLSLLLALGEPWTRDGGIPQGCPLSMMFIVALYLPWCRYLSAQVGVEPQLYADNLKCTSRDPELLLHAARFTTWYVRLVGQELAPSKCVLLSTSRAVRSDMKDWVLSQEGDKWSVKFDVRDLGGHLDTTFRGWSATLAGGPLLDIRGSLQLLNSSHVRDRDKGLLRSILVGGVWNVFLLSKVSLFLVGFVVLLTMMVIFFGNVPFLLLLVEIRDNPEFHDLMREDKAHLPRCLLWHGWLPMLSGVNGASPWAADSSESAFYLVENALGQYSSQLVSEWSLPDGFDADEVSLRLPDSPDIWSDGSLVLDSVTGVSAAGAGMFAHYSEACWSGRRWGHVDRVQSVGIDHSCRAFVSVPGPLQTVQRAELWEVILALQSVQAVHVGVDNLGVVRHVGRLLDNLPPSTPLELATDGDLLILIRRMVDLRGGDTVRITKVKGHADEGMVADGRVRVLERLGNNAADEAADFGRRRVSLAVIDARRNLSGVWLVSSCS